MNHETFIANYEKLQREENYGTHPLDMGRAVELHTWITLQLAPLSCVIDCSCGRGFLLSLLRDSGYNAEGTEASKYLIDHVLTQRNHAVRHMFYSDLPTLPAASWDAVVSNDVLEHLADEDEVRAALRELARMSRKMLLVTVGLNHARHVIDGKPLALHHVVRSSDWWIAEVGAVARVRKEYRYHNSHMIFAEVPK